MTVSVCVLNGDGDCVIVENYTASSGDDNDRIRLKSLVDGQEVNDNFYYVDWWPSEADVGKYFEIHFAVAELEAGLIRYAPGSPDMIPIKFRIDKHPMIRARVLFESRFTATETAGVLSDEFGLDATQTAQVLSDEGYGSADIGESLRDVFSLQEQETVQILDSLGCSVVDIGRVLKDVYGMDNQNAVALLKSEGFSEADTIKVLNDVYGLIAAIVDVFVTDYLYFYDLFPDYTGVSGDYCTEPYIQNRLGKRVIATDVNYGLGGTFTTIWVKYELVDKNSTTPVLVDIGVSHWPDWNIACPLDWQVANGASSGIPGALTTGTLGDCWRLGLCVKYMPLNQTDTFISNLNLSYTTSAETKCPPLCSANAGYYIMNADTVDIHIGCDDGLWVHLCYNQAEISPSMPPEINIADSDKLDLLKKYAPRVFLYPSETFFPSSVEWGFPYLVRLFLEPSDPILDIEYDRWWLVTKETLDSPSEILLFFYGNHDLNQVPVYAYWKKHQVGESIWDSSLCAKMGSLCSDSKLQAEVVDLVYYFYYPYNLGKSILGTLWGNHVSDWEHVTVRLAWSYDEVNEAWSLKPALIYIAAHDFGGAYQWDSMLTVEDTGTTLGGTHPLVYAALGSHGMWKDAGEHCYKNLGPLGELCDECSWGAPWDTWNFVEAYDYDNKKGLNDKGWPTWMNQVGVDNSLSGNANPDSGPIYRWGNPYWDDCAFGQCRRESGPVGPPFKANWDTLWID